MTPKYFFTSLTRITDFRARDFDVVRLPRADWQEGQYVVGEVEPRPSRLPLELYNGRMIEPAEGDLVVGALGRRFATLEATGDWDAIGDDSRMEALTGAGIFGRSSSRSMLLPPLLSLRYAGHIVTDGRPSTMRDFVTDAPETPLTLPVVLIIGTSMSAGKTSVACIIIRLLKKAGLRVAAAKMCGAGRYRDILSMYDAGADAICDFVDAGLSSTVVPEEEYREAGRHLVSRIAASGCDVAVVEAGASPLEPYNGATAIELLEPNIACTVLCSSDPYAALGVMEAFHTTPDLVTGVATSTIAGIALAEKLTGILALNVLEKEAQLTLAHLLRQRLDRVAWAD